jgi:hypothetical protein
MRACSPTTPTRKRDTPDMWGIILLGVIQGLIIGELWDSEQD